MIINRRFRIWRAAARLPFDDSDGRRAVALPVGRDATPEAIASLAVLTHLYAVLTHVYVGEIDGLDGHYAAATDGYCAAVVPVAMEEGDLCGLVSAEHIRDASEAADGGAARVELRDGRVSYLTRRRIVERFARCDDVLAPVDWSPPEIPDFAALMAYARATADRRVAVPDLALITPYDYGRVAEAVGIHKAGSIASTVLGYIGDNGDSRPTIVFGDPAARDAYTDEGRLVAPVGVIMPCYATA